MYTKPQKIVQTILKVLGVITLGPIMLAMLLLVIVMWGGFLFYGPYWLIFECELRVHGAEGPLMLILCSGGIWAGTIAFIVNWAFKERPIKEKKERSLRCRCSSIIQSVKEL